MKPARAYATHWTLAAAIACAFWGVSCGRTGVAGYCPLGYAIDGVTCICATDQGCPVGMSCQDGVCVCTSTSCCPSGYEYSAVQDGCFCRASSCCPRDHVWREDLQRCACGAQNCCPLGYTFDQAAGGCRCAATNCCPTGFIYDDAAQKCVCNSDLCCPVDYHFDSTQKDCVCARDSCCPSGYRYNDQVRACICVSDACCPPGYHKDPNGERCICTSAACSPGNQCCDAAGSSPACPPAIATGSGGCLCLNNSGCRSGQFCNALGFCQALAGCTANFDCPSGMFCDTTTNACIPNGPCTRDDQCAFGQMCDATATCRSGCRRHADCALITPISGPRQACIGGQCQSYCRDNNGCPVGQFCNTGSCFTPPPLTRTDCSLCPSGVCPLGAACLTFINEGATYRFCGMQCTRESDCPSGYDCGSVIYQCRTGEGGACDPDPQHPGVTMRCRGFLVENEVGTQYYCADPSGQPNVYFKACAPISGFCPAGVLP